MTNETTLEAILKEGDKNIVNYHPILPDKEYSRKPFLKAQGQLNDLEEYIQVLEKDPYNLNARKDLFELLMGDSRKHVGKSPEVIKQIGHTAYSDGIEKMSRYVEMNYNPVMNKLDGKELVRLVMNIPLYKTSDKEYKHGKVTKDKEHNELVDLINEIRSMNSEDKEIQGKVISNALSNILKSKEVPDWVKNLVQEFAGTDATFSKDILTNYKAVREKTLNGYITKDGKPDEKKLKSLINISREVAYAELNELDKKKDEKERNDIWEKVIRPEYIGIAKALYKSEKKELEKDIPEKVEKNEREERRIESLGMAA